MPSLKRAWELIVWIVGAPFRVARAWLRRLGTWVIDGLRAYTGRDSQTSPVIVGLSVIALFAALAIAGIALSTYVVFVLLAIGIFLGLYLVYRLLRFVWQSVA